MRRSFFLLVLAAMACSDGPVITTPEVGFDAQGFDTGSDVQNDGTKDIVNDLSPDASSTCNGCIVSSQFIGSFSRAEISAAVPAEVLVENGYGVHWITFSTNGRTANANVTVPDGLVNPPADGWSIVVNNPGTVGVADKCAVAFTLVGSGLSGYFGARRFVGVSIDYPGLGTEGEHPYLDAETEAYASLDAIRAVQNLLDNLGISHNGRAAIAGLSQGGHATLSAASRQPLYAPELDIRAYGVVAPASVYLSHWQPGMTVDGEHLVYHALLSYAFWRAYGPDQTSPFLDSNIDDLMNTHCLFPTDTPDLLTRVGTVRSMIFTPEFITAFTSGDFSSYPFMELGFDRNRLTPFDQTAPIRLYQGDADVVVLEASTAEVVMDLQGGNIDLLYTVVPGGQHTDIAFSFLGQPQSRTEEVISWLHSELD